MSCDDMYNFKMVFNLAILVLIFVTGFCNYKTMRIVISRITALEKELYDRKH